jgi:hypothetical protein
MLSQIEHFTRSNDYETFIDVVALIFPFMGLSGTTFAELASI